MSEPKKVWEQITPENWMKGRYCDSISGTNDASMTEQEIDEACQKAQKCCMMGWVRRVYGHGSDQYREAIRSLSAVLIDCQPAAYYLTSYNDRPDTTFEQIHTMLKTADV